ncbi:MAG TPA: hypothetical protein VG502_11085 [Flexivirga sp.]|uniref:hypothetical protein n=1 Tax=Flexivirga sp. TaxID=1962927 RepID=UPI002C827F42|nr:hypothetical protein [Flexivirga sp.]HWC22833.1 hypothetical protein [Flexivirga sp.]
MAQQIEIPVETLRRAWKLLLSHLEAVEGPVVALNEDLFWSIPAEQRHNVYVEPTTFTVGALSESLHNADHIIQGSSAVSTYALVWLADLLRATGESVVK